MTIMVAAIQMCSGGNPRGCAADKDGAAVTAVAPAKTGSAELAGLTGLSGAAA